MSTPNLRFTAASTFEIRALVDRATTAASACAISSVTSAGGRISAVHRRCISSSSPRESASFAWYLYACNHAYAVCPRALLRTDYLVHAREEASTSFGRYLSRAAWALISRVDSSDTLAIDRTQHPRSLRSMLTFSIIVSFSS